MEAKKYFSKKLIEWYQQHKRPLPWRETNDPYRIWLSEIILQQTRVNQGLPYYLRFVEKYPSVFHLAGASEQEILRLWQGLGYYTRARKLHACAKAIVTDYNGVFPNHYQALLKLPGIGTYTAAAIASFAFFEVVPVVDGNVYRVLSRHFGIDKDISKSSTKDLFIKVASEHITSDQPGVFNQAIMEFGALHCTPHNPNCGDCTLKNSCIAFKEGNQALYPVKSKKPSVRKRYFNYFVFEWKGKVLLKERGPKDIWQGLFDFYLIESKRSVGLTYLKKSDRFLQKFQIEEPSKVYKHMLSHQQLFARFIVVTVKDRELRDKILKDKSYAFYSPKQLSALPKPVLVSRYLTDKGFFLKE